MIKARPGDMLAVVKTERTFYIGQPNTERTRVDVARVTSCTRAGIAVGFEDCRGYKMGDPSNARVLVIPADTVRPEDVMRVAREHHYPEHPNQPMPWDSLDELREALRPFLVATN